MLSYFVFRFLTHIVTPKFRLTFPLGGGGPANQNPRFQLPHLEQLTLGLYLNLDQLKSELLTAALPSMSKLALIPPWSGRQHPEFGGVDLAHYLRFVASHPRLSHFASKIALESVATKLGAIIAQLNLASLTRVHIGTFCATLIDFLARSGLHSLSTLRHLRIYSQGYHHSVYDGVTFHLPTAPARPVVYAQLKFLLIPIR